MSEELLAPTNDRKSGFVAIAGRPNAGKSTILNALLGTNLSIVSSKAQTTREAVNGVLTEEEGQIVFVDTPGIHRAKDGGINAYMMAEVRTALSAPDLVWYLVDPDSAPKHELAVLEILERTKSPVFLILNKSDRPGATEKIKPLEIAMQAAMKERGIDLRGTYRLSALKRRGVETLLSATWELLPVGPFHYADEDQISDRPTRFFVAEKIREQLFTKLGEELPYACAIGIDKFDENSKPVRVEATIYVERESQKGMVIGAKGAKIKDIGMHARHQIDKFLDTKVFLGLNVKVLKDWSKDPERMRQLGYNLPKKEA
ncbi:MAG: GTPase Era [Bdellovibrionales bacterium]|nr:GTPase Era [Bdellovibrionales bacterium]